VRDGLIVRDGDVDTAVIAEYEATRRDALRRGIAVGGIAIGATAIPTLLRIRNAFGQDGGGDARILASAIRLEQTAVVAYDTVATSGLLQGKVRRTAELFRDQEQEHADGLRAALQALGGEAPAPPERQRVPGLSELRSAADVASFAIELETMAIAAYYRAHARLKDPKLLATAARIMANEGQHLAVLRPLVNKPAVPDAFETGQG
jgi:rubrerythrin